MKHHLSASIAIVLSASTTQIYSADNKLIVEKVASKLTKPVEVRAPKAHPQSLYIVEKIGKIKIYNKSTGNLAAKPFLDISSKVQSKSNEQGLLSIAFAEDFQQSKRFYVYYTNVKGDTVLSRFQARSYDSASADSEEILLTQKQDYKNHNGGALRFGPDGMLYVALGDGGAANDPKQRSQDLGSLLGKLLRIDVSPAKGYRIPADNPFVKTQGARAEILSYGLRNPWRICWDADTLFIADVGQNKYEEVNAVRSKDLFSANFGWPQIEGFKKTKNKKPKTKNPGRLITPVYVYKHGSNDFQGYSISGAAIATSKHPRLTGKFLFADYVSHHFWSGTLDSGKLTKLRQHTLTENGKTITIKQMASIDHTPDGGVYITSHQGQVYRVVE